MCERREQLSAVRNAADGLTAACFGLCPDIIGDTLKSLWRTAENEPIPRAMTDKLRRLK